MDGDVTLVHCIWNDGVQVHGSQNLDTFREILQNGVNIYSWLPIELLVKFKMFQSPYNSWDENELVPSFRFCQTLSEKMINTDFCQSNEAIMKFWNSISQSRVETHAPVGPILLKSVVETVQNQLIWIENLTFKCRLDSENTIRVVNPEPRKQFYRRNGDDQHHEEKAFLKIFAETPKDMESMNLVYPHGVAGSREFRTMVKDIKEEKKLEFTAKPVDISLMDWLTSQKSQPLHNKLDQILNLVDNLHFDSLEGILETEIKKAENEMLGSIKVQLERLKRLQLEKQCFSRGDIKPELFHQNCFPEIAKTCSKLCQDAKMMDISSITSDEPEFEVYDSWTDTWSSE